MKYQLNQKGKYTTLKQYTTKYVILPLALTELIATAGCASLSKKQEPVALEGRCLNPNVTQAASLGCASMHKKEEVKIYRTQQKYEESHSNFSILDASDDTELGKALSGMAKIEKALELFPPTYLLLKIADWCDEKTLARAQAEAKAKEELSNKHNKNNLEED